MRGEGFDPRSPSKDEQAIPSKKNGSCQES